MAATDSIDTHSITGASDAPAFTRRETARGNTDDAAPEPRGIFRKAKQSFEAWLADVTAGTAGFELGGEAYGDA